MLTLVRLMKEMYISRTRTSWAHNVPITSKFRGKALPKAVLATTNFSTKGLSAYIFSRGCLSPIS